MEAQGVGFVDGEVCPRICMTCQGYVIERVCAKFQVGRSY